MRDGWKTCTLGEVADTQLGKTLPRGSGSDADGLPYLRNVNVQWGHVSTENLNHMAFSLNEQEQLSLRAGDILVCEGGEVGRLAFLTEDLPGIFFQNALHRIRVNRPGVLPGFVRLALEHLVQSGGLEGLATQVTIAHLNQHKLRSLPLSIPPLAEQRRIVDLVSALDHTIGATSNRAAAMLHVQLLEQWMSRPGLPLSSALRLSSESAAVMPDDEYRILGVVRSGGGFIDRGVVAGSDIAYSRLYQVRRNQLVYRKLTAWEGPITVSSDVEEGGWVSNEFPRFDIDSHILHPDLLRHICRWPGLWHRIGQRLVGSVQRRKRLNPVELLQIEVPMPSMDEQLSRLALLDGAWAVGTKGGDTSVKLLRVRSNLLTALLSGEHEIPESYDELIEGVA